jgi:iron(III) transport system ATP-binding protein
VLYVTHDQEEALAVSDKVIVMDNAVIAQEGTPEDLYERPRSRFLADFIGEANLIEGEFRRDRSGTMFVAGDVKLSLGHLPVPADASMIALRPDRLALAEAADGALTIRRRAYLGHAWEYTLDAPWGELLVLAPTREKPLALGARVNLKIDADAAIPLGGKPA